MGKNSECQNVQLCQFGLPGFSNSSISTSVEDMNSYQFDMVGAGGQCIANFIRQQKILFLTGVFSYPSTSGQLDFTFNDLTVLIGATNLQVGMINPIGTPIFTTVTLVGSTLNFRIGYNTSVPGPLYTIFSVSYTPAV